MGKKKGRGTPKRAEAERIVAATVREMGDDDLCGYAASLSVLHQTGVLGAVREASTGVDVTEHYCRQVAKEVLRRDLGMQVAVVIAGMMEEANEFADEVVQLVGLALHDPPTMQA